MCRMFGFRSVLDSHVHRSLMSADNAIAVQSKAHPDGWGVAYYASGAPHVIKSAGTAMTDHLFQRVSGVVTSQTVVAHIRKATQGDISTLNCHPFQFGRWILAHNGDVRGFAEVVEPLKRLIAPKFRCFLLGDTDSEVIFHLFLTHLCTRADLSRRGTPVEAVVTALRTTVEDVRRLSSQAGLEDPLLTLLVTDGETMAGHRSGKELYFSTHKRSCSERTSCHFFSAECEAPTRTGYVNHLIVSSEPLQGENVWTPLEEDEVVAVDHFMRFERFAT